MLIAPATASTAAKPQRRRSAASASTTIVTSTYWTRKCVVSSNIQKSLAPSGTTLTMATTAAQTTSNRSSQRMLGAQRPQEHGGIGAALEHFDERRADDDAVGVGAEQRDLVGAPHAEATHTGIGEAALTAER